MVPSLIACLGDDCRDLSSFIEPTDEEAEGKTTYVFEDVFVEWPTGTALLSGFYNPDFDCSCSMRSRRTWRR